MSRYSYARMTPGERRRYNDAKYSRIRPTPMMHVGPICSAVTVAECQQPSCPVHVRVDLDVTRKIAALGLLGVMELATDLESAAVYFESCARLARQAIEDRSGN